MLTQETLQKEHTKDTLRTHGTLPGQAGSGGFQKASWPGSSVGDWPSWPRPRHANSRTATLHRGYLVLPPTRSTAAMYAAMYLPVPYCSYHRDAGWVVHTSDSLSVRVQHRAWSTDHGWAGMAAGPFAGSFGPAAKTSPVHPKGPSKGSRPRPSRANQAIPPQHKWTRWTRWAKWDVPQFSHRALFRLATRLSSHRLTNRVLLMSKAASSLGNLPGLAS